MNYSIVAEHVSKQYRLGGREPYGALRDVLARGLSAPLRVFRRRHPADTTEDDGVLWALKDVSFEIRDGEVIGIIGRNGSGKSTLLKILSRITEPTKGRVTVRGRVGSLLEVGTGFHPELSGRENVFVNGAILGMTRRDIIARFDDIVAFAGLERFIDTAVKHYSSGMQVRLAFAVAAHLEPEILLVDEVLAVGDAEFQRRCLGKMEEVSRQGRTVLLVSHQLGQIRRLCESVIWLQAGQVQAIGPAGATIHAYESAALSTGTSEGIGFRGWELASGGHVITDQTRPFTIRIYLGLKQPVTNGHFGIGIIGEDDQVLAGWAFEPLEIARHVDRLDITIPQLPLRPGLYRLSFALFTGGNNLTGGRLIEKWIAAPELGLDVRPLGHPQDAWAGVLNLSAMMSIPATGEAMASAGDADLETTGADL